MVSINTVYQRVQQLMNKSQVGGYLSPTEFNNYANMANLGLLNVEYDQFQKTQKITDRLSSFIDKKQSYANNKGEMAYPSDYFYFVALRTYDRDSYMVLVKECGDIQPTINDYRKLPQVAIKTLDNDKLGIRNQSALYRPNYNFPIAIFYTDYIQILPIDLGVTVIDYIKKPVTVVWNYTNDAYGLPVYTSTGSVNFEWDANVENALVMEICKYAGIEIRELEITKVTNELESQGQ